MPRRTITPGEVIVVIASSLAALMSLPTAPLVCGVVVAVVVLILALDASGTIPREFYAVCAQINPVFLVALVVEQRLADRLGKSENQDAEAAREAWRRQPAHLAPDEEWRHWSDEHQGYTWVVIVATEGEVSLAARRRYQRTLAVQALTIIAAVVTLMVGEAAAVVGLVRDGTTADCVLFPLTLTMLAASFTIIVVAALGELMRGVLPRYWRLEQMKRRQKDG